MSRWNLYTLSKKLFLSFVHFWLTGVLTFVHVWLAGMTALHDACYYGFEDIADILIRNGASVNCFDKDGQTPLHVRFIQAYHGWQL